jgi:hypothetical protein
MMLAVTLMLSDRCYSSESSSAISLAGQWQFERGGPSSKESTLPSQLKLLDTIELPGTTDTNRKGPPNTDKSLDSLSQPYNFQGTCWYQRSVTVPQAWKGKRLTLFLERTKFTKAFVDNRPVGENPIICTPQEYDLGTGLKPGPHLITIAVDNTRLPPYGADAHQISGSTQGNWNGIIGEIKLEAHDLVSIDSAQVFPDAASRSVTVKVRLRSDVQTPGVATLSLTATGPGVPFGKTQKQSVSYGKGTREISTTLHLGPKAELWDEFHPALQKLTVQLNGAGFSDAKTVVFGLRTFATHDHQFSINGHAVFLRGKHDACVFPLTGHPPMDVAGWNKYFGILKSYGLNHVRFHTWTPPEAAFVAADEAGFYLQPELPFWGSFDAQVKTALKPEALKIFERFSNHPSFVMFSLGNEHWASEPVLDSLVAELRAADPRHLYVRGTNAISWRGRPGPNDDYMVAADVKALSGTSYKVRGSNMGTGDVQGHIQSGPANTLATYSGGVSAIPVPLVGHEIGQFTMYPNYAEIAKYTGVDRASNLEHFRDELAEAGMADQDPQFAHASGELATLCYREDIESYLRTPHMGGFDLLDLQDYPGQGTALVGILDAFLDSKGLITPEHWRQFCAPTVLLAKFNSYVWKSSQTFSAEVDLANYGATDLQPSHLTWSLTDKAGHVVGRGSVKTAVVSRGGLRKLGTISAALAKVTIAESLKLSLALSGTGITTSYPIWVYPNLASFVPPMGVTVTRSFDAEARKALAAGKRVLVVCDASLPLARTVGGGFASDYWSFRFFQNKPGTVGLLCDPKNPALAEFPTESHSNWQWFNLAKLGQPLVLDGAFPKTYRPIVQEIDNCDRNHKIGLIFEAKVGKGSLLVCATDVLQFATNHPEARQMVGDLYDYVGSSAFHPGTEVSMEAATDLLKTTLPLAGAKVTASSFDPSWKNYKAENAIDGNDSKGWQATPDSLAPAWIQIDFASPTDLNGGEILWTDPHGDYKYMVEYTTDGSTWQTLSDQRTNAFTSPCQSLPFVATGAKAVRVTIMGAAHGATLGIQEIRLFGPDK